MISIKNVSKWYGQFQVLTDCTTEVKKGEVVVVCGPSGSGKSTLIKTVNGLEPFQKGEIVDQRQSHHRQEDQPVEAALESRHGVPALRAVSASVDRAEPDARADQGAGPLEGRSDGEGIEAARSRGPVARTRTSSPASSPAASSSAWRLRARCRWIRSRCCSTSPRPRSIRK